MPPNSQVQARLERAIAEMVRRGGVRLDPSAQQYIGELIATATDRIEQDGLLDDPEAIDRAEHAFRLLVKRASPARREGALERRGRDDYTMTITAASFEPAFRGLCPLWPIC